MAYSTNGLIRLGGDNNGHSTWQYSSADVDDTVNGASYFSDGVARGMKSGDAVIVIDTTTPKASLCYVSTVGATAVTTSFGAVS